MHPTAGLLRVVACLAALAAAAWLVPARADDITPAMREAIETHFAPSLLHPETAHWHYDLAKPYTLGGILVCGHVNYMNSDRRYLGERPFYTVYKNGGCHEGGIMSTHEEDPTGTVAFTVRLLCGSQYELPGS